MSRYSWPKAIVTVAWGNAGNAPGRNGPSSSHWPKAIFTLAEGCPALVNMAFGQKNGLALVPGALPALPQATVRMAFGQTSRHHERWSRLKIEKLLFGCP
jgi:hypothetical protein